MSTGPAVVHTELLGDVVLIVLDNPPVNTGTARLRSELLSALRGIGERPDVRGVVLTGAGRHFYSGSDLVEFDDAVLAPPELPEIIATIEQLPVPVVAAMRGAGLGGGYELALGADARIADPTAVVGLPETSLGIIPGAGGTVRLTRAVAPATALHWIATAARVPAAEAVAAGGLDEVVAPGRLIDRAAETARSIPKRRLREAAPRPGGDLDAVAAEVTGWAPPEPQIREAVASVRRAVTWEAARALDADRDVFHRLRLGAEAVALRHRFLRRRPAIENHHSHHVERNSS